MKRIFTAIAILVAASTQSQASDCCKAAATCAPCPQVACQAQPACQPAVQWKEVERKVLVSEWVTEKQTVTRTEYKRETTDREITVNKWVQKKDKVKRDVIAYVVDKVFDGVAAQLASHLAEYRGFSPKDSKALCDIVEAADKRAKRKKGK